MYVSSDSVGNGWLQKDRCSQPKGSVQSLATDEENFFRIYNKPTMNELVVLKGNGITVRIIERINGHYYKIGIYLLNDDNGNILKTIEVEEHGRIEAITRQMLNSWIEGKGKDMTWKTLVYALKEIAQLRSLADDIVTALQANNGG